MTDTHGSGDWMHPTLCTDQPSPSARGSWLIKTAPLAAQKPNRGCSVRATQPENLSGASVAATQMHGTPGDVTG